MLTRNTDLADIVVERPAAARVFTQLGLDYCCHGRRSLADACAERGLDPDAVLAEVERAGATGHNGTRPEQLPPPALADYIVERFHRKLRRDLPTLVAQARTVELAHRDKPSYPHGLPELLERVQEAVNAHMDKEEEILFPVIRTSSGPVALMVALMPVKVMMEEHEDLGRELARLRGLTNGFSVPPEACGTWQALYTGLAELEADLFEHVHLENNVLYPRILAVEDDAAGEGGHGH